jgi:MFS family permease
MERRRAIGFVVLLGLVSLLADITYEGARSITGPFLAGLGASGAAVGFVAGFGELLGYGLRLVSGVLADRTKRYWTMTIAGYAVNLLAVPALALAERWEIAAGLMILERTGKAIRNPPRDAMLSHATSEVGRGWGFGLHEAMDQAGAVTGPLLAAFFIQTRSGFRDTFAVLLIPAVAALTVLLAARFLYPKPQDLERVSKSVATEGLGKRFWLYMGAAGLLAAGTVDYPLIAFHFQRTGVAAEAWIPSLYAIAMGVDAIAALVFGRFYDRVGIRVLLPAAAIAACAAPLAFGGGFAGAMLGMACWGVGMGAQESVLRAAVGDMAPRERRASAYGVFNAGYGLLWFAGSALAGALYDRSPMAVAVVSSVLTLASTVLFLREGREERS